MVYNIGLQRYRITKLEFAEKTQNNKKHTKKTILYTEHVLFGCINHAGKKLRPTLKFQKIKYLQN